MKGYNFAMRMAGALLSSVLMLSGIFATSRLAQASDPAYVVRGHEIEKRQRELKEKLDGFYASLEERLRHEAPELLAALAPVLSTLQPPPPIVYGYQILPPIVADKRGESPSKPHVASYSWPLTADLISKEMTSLDRLQSELESIAHKPAAEKRAAYEALIAEYKNSVDRRRLIDADVNYNWLWQRQIAEDRPLFDRLTAQLNTAVEQLQPPSGGGAEAAAFAPKPPDFMRLDQAGGVQTVTVPLYTDITDRVFVEAFRRAIETHWHARDGDEEYRVILKISPVSAEQLYCSAKDAAAKPAAHCTPPVKGEHINLEAHVARFPKDAAVLTTGAASLQLVDDRAIVLGPHDVAPRALAHEFGHVLGFPDVYLRGYKDLGEGGFEVLELVPNFRDIMMSPGAGSVLPGHFKALLAAKETQDLMQAGLDALYKEGDAATAVARFREVLARNPDHYGATLQLAKALDAEGQREESLILWRKMLVMAKAAGDIETMQVAQARLGDTAH
jgi:tetratricopeptide (TPR) repeat protein